MHIKAQWVTSVANITLYCLIIKVTKLEYGIMEVSIVVNIGFKLLPY